MEKIDILMATYNGEKYLKEQIESILSQTYKSFRLIISDDCSSDKTKEILNEYAKKDSRIILYFQQQNLGYVKNFEFLLTKVESPIYMLSDQDDIWLSEKVEEEYKILEKENADLVFCDLEVINNEKEILNKSFTRHKNLYRKIQKCQNSYKIEYLYNCITGCTIMCKSKFLKYILPLPNNTKYLIHDYWIGIVLSLKGKIKYIDKPYIKYRQHEQNQVGSKTVSNLIKKFENLREMFIDVKIELFTTYVSKKNIFTEELQKQNLHNLKYFNMLKCKKNINFKNWKIFYNLYKEERFSYYILNFLILNIPIIAKIGFNIKKLIKSN